MAGEHPSYLATAVSMSRIHPTLQMQTLTVNCHVNVTIFNSDQYRNILSTVCPIIVLVYDTDAVSKLLTL
jgi:hypothetical protein